VYAVAVIITIVLITAMAVVGGFQGIGVTALGFLVIAFVINSLIQGLSTIAEYINLVVVPKTFNYRFEI